MSNFNETPTKYFEYEKDENGNLTITNYTGNFAEVVIPSKIDGIAVKSIGSSAFSNHIEIVKLTIPNGIEYIELAFYGCRGLTDIIISETVSFLYDSFECCEKLENILVDEHNKYFSSKDGVLFDKQAKKLIRCPNAKKGVYKIPYNITEIEDYAFSECSGLTNVIIPDSVEHIGLSAFSECSGLTEIKLSESLCDIDTYAFYSCSNLKTVIIPHIVCIGEYVFSLCEKLSYIKFPESLKVIGNGAFEECCSIENIFIPKNVEYIGSSVFESCINLLKIDIDENNKFYKEKDGIVFRACSHKKSIKNHSQHDNRKKN